MREWKWKFQMRPVVDAEGVGIELAPGEIVLTLIETRDNGPLCQRLSDACMHNDLVQLDIAGTKAKMKVEMVERMVIR